MAIESPPWALQSGSFNAEQTRRAVFSWAARTSANSPGIVSGGTFSASDCLIQAPASGLSIQITPGEMLIPGNEGGAQGPGYARITSTSSVSLSAADPTNPRVDLCCATMSDAQYAEPTGGSGSQWALQVVTGTPTSGATLSNLSGVGTLPGSSLLLGYVLVPAGASNIVSGDIANKASVVQLAFGQETAGWVNLSLATGWGQATSGYLPAAKLIGDRVYLRGGILGGSSPPVTFATLPSGLRPTANVAVVGVVPGGTQTDIVVDPSGNMTLPSTSASMSVYMDGQNFSLS